MGCLKIGTIQNPLYISFLVLKYNAGLGDLRVFPLGSTPGELMPLA